MGHNVRLIVPTDNDLELAPIIGKILGRWGGCTVTSGKGWWNNREHGQFFDRLSVVDCSIGSWDQDAQDWWNDLASAVCSTFEQKCIFLSVSQETATLVRMDGMVRKLGGEG